MDDDAKKRILARRAQFVAAAVASFVACEPSPELPPPSVCLSIAVPMPPEDGGPQPTIVDAGAAIEPDASVAPEAGDTLPPPMPCLSLALPRDSGAPADAGAVPHPCLRKVAPPRICLDYEGP